MEEPQVDIQPGVGILPMTLRCAENATREHGHLLMTQNDLPWMKRNDVIVVLLILFAPVGIYLVWKHSDWTRRTRVVATVLSLLLFAHITGQRDTSTAPAEPPQTVGEDAPSPKALPKG